MTNSGAQSQLSSSGAAVSSGVQCTPVAKKKHRVGELGLMKAAFNYMHGPLPGISSGSGEPAPAGVGRGIYYGQPENLPPPPLII